MSSNNLLEGDNDDDAVVDDVLPWGSEGTEDQNEKPKVGIGAPLLDDSNEDELSQGKSMISEDHDEIDAYIVENLIVSVVEFERRIGPDGEFVAFKIESKLKPGAEETEIGREAKRQFPDGAPFSVWRRFNNFELLVSFLLFKFPYAIVPPIPEKTINFKITKLGGDKFDPQFIEKRRVGFQGFLRRLLQHPILSKSPIIIHFVQNQNWRQFVTVRTAEGLRKKWQPNPMDDALRVFPKPKNPHQPFVDEREALDKLKENIICVLKIHIRIATCIHGIHGHLIDFGDSLSNIVEIGSGKKIPLFDMIGQQFDSMTGTGPELLKREELCFADRLKEYAQFTDCAREVLDNVDVIQVKYEKAQSNCAAKRKSIESWRNPQRASVSGFFKSFASKDTSDTKAAQEELELKELEEIEADLERETAVVLQAVTEELDRFDTNQVRGIKGVLLEYGRIQQQYCRKNLAYWTEMKLACDDVDTTMMTSSTFILQ